MLATPTRRAVLVALAAASAMPAVASPLPKVVVSKDPSCGCCGAWVEHLRAAGFPVEVVETAALNRVKARLQVPAALASCHTGEVGGYVVEGHVPAAAIRRLLAERPSGRGLAVPGMPIGSPGMEVEGEKPERFEVILFGGGSQRVYATYEGEREV